MQDIVMALYAQGKMDEVMQLVQPNPSTSYDTLAVAEPLLPYIVNYLDASVFATAEQALYTNWCLQMLMKHENVANEFQEAFSARIIQEYQLLGLLVENTPISLEYLFKIFDNERQGTFLKANEIEEIKSQVPREYRQLIEDQLVLSQGWLVYQQHKAAHAACFKAADVVFRRPWQTFRYQLEPVNAPVFSSEMIPVLFLEPVAMDYAKVLEPLRDRPVLFVFDTRAKFFQMLQFPEVLNALCMPHHLVYILEIYPNIQLDAQAYAQIRNYPLQSFMNAERPILKTVIPLLLEAIEACLKQPNLEGDSDISNWLYHIARRFLYRSDEQRLGLSRIMGLEEYRSAKRWYDPHKGLPPLGKDIGPPLFGYQTKLEQLAKKRRPNSKKSSDKIKLVHVVPQIVDGGHAPSRLLETLIFHHDPSRFELCIISSERMQFHWFEYPYNTHCSDSSTKRAPNRIREFQQRGISVQVLNNIPSYERTAIEVVRHLDSLEADVVVFHSPDIINTMATQMTNTSLRVLFDHGDLPVYAGYDLVLASSADFSEKQRARLKELKSDVRILPFAIDVRSGWLPQPFTLEQWKMPSDSVIMTTISQHLDHRLSSEMQLAIVEILKRVPHAYYVPMGRVEDVKKFKSFFHQYGVANRVIFIGPVINPSQYARSMRLYLNEFPFGSGLGMLDAMASGCPVVSMYDPAGPPQARYGAGYMGIERTVTSGKREDYVDLACRLLTDEHLYQEWSEHAKKQYELHADVKGYVKAFEENILKVFNSNSPNS